MRRELHGELREGVRQRLKALRVFGAVHLQHTVGEALDLLDLLRDRSMVDVQEMLVQLRLRRLRPITLLAPSQVDAQLCHHDIDVQAGVGTRTR